MNANQTHPIITFRVNLVNSLQEKIGPNTNQQTVTMLHPDRHVNREASAELATTLGRDIQKVTWLPGLLAAENIELKNGSDTFTVTGSKATYLKNMYTSGDRAFLTVVTETWASEATSPNV